MNSTHIFYKYYILKTTHQKRQIIKDIADKQHGVDGGPAAGLVDLESTLLEAGPTVGRAAGAGAAGGFPVLLVQLALVSTGRRVLGACLRQVGHALEQLGFGPRPAGASEQGSQQAVDKGF